MKYCVTNVYFNEIIFSKHKSLDLAFKAQEKHEGLGWQVMDSNGGYWDSLGDGNYIQF